MAKGKSDGAEQVNKVTVADAGPSRKKLTFSVPKETVASSLGVSIETLMMEAELPGFRKGRAPRRLIEKRFGSAISRQAKETLVSQAYGKAVEDHKLRVLGNPVAKDMDKLELDPAKDFDFEIEVEVLPEFDLPKLDGIEVKKPKLDVTDKMVDDELKKLAIQEGSLDERQAPEPGDYLTGHAKMTGPDGKVAFDSEGIVVQVPPAERAPKGMIVGLVVDDLSTQLGLPTVGQTATVKTTGPENHENEALRGQALTIEYTPARIDRIIPLPTADLVARFGMADEAGLKMVIRDRLEGRVRVEQQGAMHAQVAKALLEQTKMDLPQRVTAEQAARTFERRRVELLYRGVDAAKIEENIAELRSASAGEAVRDLKLFFIVDKAAQELGVTVSDAEVGGRIAQIAQERGVRPDQMRQQIMQSNQLGAIWGQIREHKTMDAILAKAKVQEMPIEDYNKFINEQNAAQAGNARNG
jgi:trigger factor